MTEEQIRHMVDRFLGWRLPKPWRPDNGISYQRPNYMHAPADHDWPTGTNLFDADQATAMVRHMLEGMPSARSKTSKIREAAQTIVSLFVWEPNEETGEVEPHLDRQVPHLNDALTQLRDALR